MSERVAVIAVHGVADQLPFVTARATADLLKCRVNNDAFVFREEQLRLEIVPLRDQSPTGELPVPEAAADNLEVLPPAADAHETKLMTQSYAGVKLSCDQPDKAADDTKRKVLAPAARDVPQGLENRDPTAQKDQAEREAILNASRDASLEYFAAQIDEYRQRPADAIYETVRLSSTVRGKQVDIYEAYWADLSRVALGIFQAFEELYYVLFAVCNIGRMELERSQRLFTGGSWDLLRWWEGFAERILILVVPLANMCLFLLLIFTLPQLLPDGTQIEHWKFLLPSGLGVGLVVGAISFGLFSPDRPARACSYLWKCGLAGGVIGLGIGLLPHRPCIRFVLAILMWSACAVVLIALAKRFNKRQPGARTVSLYLVGLMSVAVWYEASQRVEQGKFWAVDIGLATAEWAMIGLTFVWLAYLIAAAACSFLGWLAVRSERKSSPRYKTAERIVWTANLAILAPGMLSIVLNLGIWQALYTAEGYLIPKLIPAALSHKPICLYAGPLQNQIELEKLAEIKKRERSGHLSPPNAEAQTAEVAQKADESGIEANRIPGLLIHNSALPMIVVFVALVLMLLSAAWLLLPAILSEGATGSDTEYAQQLGNSLSFAWRGLRWCAEPLVRWQLFVLLLICLGIALTPPVVGADGWNLKYELFVWSEPALWVTGWLFVGLATGVIQYAGLRTVVDVAADVANWLRLHPRDNNPTSRISARYVSLLRYVAQRKDDKDQPYYERIVIFAHSLGSVITVDLLQFLQQRPDEGLARMQPGQNDKLPVYLFTHGCPLRQLLGLRLPITYGWAWHGSKGWDANEEPLGEELLGVVKWVNAYCSGDYVGRHLWHNDESDKPWDATCRQKGGAVPRVELCVGAGAHVHYWDPDPQAGGKGATQAPSTQIVDELLKLIGVRAG